MTAKQAVSAFIAPLGKTLELKKWQPQVPDICSRKAAYEDLMELLVVGLSRLQALRTLLERDARLGPAVTGWGQPKKP